MKTLKCVGAMVGAAALAASIVGASPAAHAHRARVTFNGNSAYSFMPIANPTDPTFTQLLGINSTDTIAGYYGSGADAQHPNKGFVLNLPNAFTPENYPNSAQTQVIGINERGDTDGFYIDNGGTTHGFVNIGGTFSTVDVPGTTFNQLLGLNNRGEQAGYYQFGPSNAPVFVPFIRRADGEFSLLPIANAQATSINDSELVGGFYNDDAGNSHGYLWQAGSPLWTVDYPHATSTQILGLNNQQQAVGTFTDTQNTMHGFVFSVRTRTFQQVDAPGAMSTVVNGINRQGRIVGFYTIPNPNGNTPSTYTIGFVGTPRDRH